MQSRRPHARVAILGHRGHGKTALVEALRRHLAGATRDAGSHPGAGAARGRGAVPVAGEGSSLRVRHTGLTTERWTLTIHDCPGARRSVRHTGRTLLGIEAVIVVVAADEGVGVQTREHLFLARAMGVQHVVVFVSRCDRAGPEEIELTEGEAREALAEAGLGERPVLRGAAPAVDPDGVWGPTYRDLLAALEPGLSPVVSPPGSAPLGWVQDVLGPRVIEGRPGAARLLCGGLRRGLVRVGQELTVRSRYQPALSTIVASLEVDHQACDEATVGPEIGMVLLGAGRDTTALSFRRATLHEPGSFARARVVECSLQLLPTRAGGRWTPLRNGHTPFAFMAHDGMPATVELPGGVPQLDPGEGLAGVRLRLSWGALVLPGDRFVLADGIDPVRRAWGGEPGWYGSMASGVVTRVLEVESEAG